MTRTLGSPTKSRPATDARQRAWSAMRYLGQFTDAEVIAIAEIGGRNLRAYRQRLVAAGYLREVKARRSGASMGHAVYDLTRNTGPRHPIARSEGGMYDPNNGDTYGNAADADGAGGTGVARRPAASV